MPVCKSPARSEVFLRRSLVADVLVVDLSRQHRHAHSLKHTPQNGIHPDRDVGLISAGNEGCRPVSLSRRVVRRCSCESRSWPQAEARQCRPAPVDLTRVPPAPCQRSQGGSERRVAPLVVISSTAGVSCSSSWRHPAQWRVYSCRPPPAGTRYCRHGPWRCGSSGWPR